MQNQPPDALRRRLLAEWRRYRDMIARLNESGLALTQGDAFSEFSLYDNHPADAGTETFEREKDLGLRIFLTEQLRAVEQALERMRQGQYGVCQRCGGAIPAERLAAIPHAALCLPCQAATEQEPDVSPRPAEERALDPPFGRSFRDDTGDPGYDGEDVWQDVARYGTSEGPQDVPRARDYDDIYQTETAGIVSEVDAVVDPETEPGD